MLQSPAWHTANLHACSGVPTIVPRVTGHFAVRPHLRPVESKTRLCVTADEVSGVSFSFRVEQKENTHPDFDDDDWIEKVTSWDEFWNYQKWNVETDDLDDEHDALATANGSGVERAEKLVQALQQLEGRDDVVNFIPRLEDSEVHDVTQMELTPVSFERNPRLDACDLRAIMEKKRRKDILDREWRRRQSLLGKFRCAQYEHDLRVTNDTPEKVEWTEEEIMDLITLNGHSIHPSQHKGLVENPLLGADYVTDHDVHYIEETEELLQRCGHFADGFNDDLLDQDVWLQPADFDNPDAIFEPEQIPYGNVWMAEKALTHMTLEALLADPEDDGEEYEDEDDEDEDDFAE